LLRGLKLKTIDAAYLGSLREIFYNHRLNEQGHGAGGGQEVLAEVNKFLRETDSVYWNTMCTWNMFYSSKLTTAPLRVDKKLSNEAQWRGAHEKDETALPIGVQDIHSG